MMEMLNDKIMPVILIGCLVIGYILKKWLPVDNKLIPTVLTIIGATTACMMTHSFTIEIAVYGGFTGLASTGMHQVFKNYIEMGRTKGDEK